MGKGRVAISPPGLWSKNVSVRETMTETFHACILIFYQNIRKQEQRSSSCSRQKHMKQTVTRGQKEVIKQSWKG